MLSVITSTRDTWVELNFGDLLKQLESTVVELASNRESGETSRASLVQLTRDFRKSASEETRKAVLSLLKSYQSEVDASRKRCAYAEEAYLTIYKKLIELPDPTLALMEVQSLQKKANKCAELECEVRRLKESNDQLKSEVSAAKQLEHENIRLQKSVDDLTQKISSQLKDKCAEIEKTSAILRAEREQEILIIKAETEGKLHSMEEKVLNLTNALELAQSELFSRKLEADKLETGKSSELDILLEDLDKANNRIHDLEARLSSSDEQSFDARALTEQIAQLQSKLEGMESDLQLKENEVARYLSINESLRQEKDSQQSKMLATIGDLESTLAATKSQLSVVEAQLTSQSDYSEVCRELALLRSIEFPDTIEPSGRGEPEGKIDASHVDSHFPAPSRPPLESLLMHKNRALQNQLAELSSMNDRIQVELTRVQLCETEARQQIREQTELITLLEADLYRAQTAVSRQAELPVGGIQSSGLGGRMLAEAIGDDSPSSDFLSPGLVDPSLLHIVEHQRDRFRARTNELEQVESNLRQQLLTLQREMQSVRSDNVKLYEKIRFLQSYSGPSSWQASLKDRTSNSSIITDLPLAVDQKYSQAYEANLDPFNQFSRQERLRHYQILQPHEKVMLKIVRLVVGNRRARLGAFVYALALHILVFLALYNAVHFQNSAADTEASCLQRYAEHMRSVHKDMSH